MTAADTTAAEKAVADAKAKLAEFPTAEEIQAQIDEQKGYVEIQKGTLSYAEEALDKFNASAEYTAASEEVAKWEAAYIEAEKALKADPSDVGNKVAAEMNKKELDKAQAKLDEFNKKAEALEIRVSNAKATLTELEVGVAGLNDKLAARAAAEKAVADAQKALDALKGQTPKVDPKADPKAEKPAPKADPKKDADKKADPKKEVKKADAKKLANSGVDAGAAAGGAALLLLAGGAFVAYRKFA
ncbi:hypothetical protein DDD64_04950 [Actinotignum sanguinis]|uniref:hypothetical protein n=1 Tax=Actinotignum sanguinis TaxID=1445614 RepID=UPI000F7F2F5F|nr:hypothetical protein [Actinotignum sanguinis]MDY5147837.1 hypothetical protein [Actinotignum sanguinis]RTE49733.1 hypothetical protein DDD64_04950 [Actinotignum sanguinis]